jgi:hypothetical protein
MRVFLRFLKTDELGKRNRKNAKTRYPTYRYSGEKRQSQGQTLQELTDGGGMYLVVNPDGMRYWCLDFRLNEKRNTRYA